jgi:hypothetical protein
VARSLAAGGFIPNIAALAKQSDYEYYNHGGKVYDLLWVSSVQGMPLGLEDYLKVIGWRAVGSSPNDVKEGYVLICIGSDGPHSHTGIGVGAGIFDAHNSARYRAQASICGYGINVVYAPPN